MESRLQFSAVKKSSWLVVGANRFRSDAITIPVRIQIGNLLDPLWVRYWSDLDPYC